MSKLFTYLFLCFCLSLAAVVQAETRLSARIIDMWLNANDALQIWGRRYEARLARHETDSAANFFSGEISGFIKPLKLSGLYDDADALLDRYGFESPEAWADITIRIMRALAAVEMPQGYDLAGMKRELEMLQNNPNISSEQKEMMAQLVEEDVRMMAGISKASKKDIAVVNRHIAKIKARLDEMGVEDY